MDFQHRPGGKTGVGGVASASDANRDRRERLRQLALETIDLNKVKSTSFDKSAALQHILPQPVRGYCLNILVFCLSFRNKMVIVFGICMTFIG